ncbi:MAG: hypothetical protein MZU97_21380 [Bacillus subtilis]|nr:hypothetical protein [Bacillus subtilis]
MPEMIDATYVKPGAVVIDVGISKVDGVIQGRRRFRFRRTCRLAGSRPFPAASDR